MLVVSATTAVVSTAAVSTETVVESVDPFASDEPPLQETKAKATMANKANNDFFILFFLFLSLFYIKPSSQCSSLKSGSVEFLLT
jgi:hypothetical protein